MIASRQRLHARMHGRRGIVLLTVLWMLTTAGLLALAAIVATRDTIGAGSNRIAGMRARWHAEGCAARAVAALGEAMRSGSSDSSAAVWMTVDRRLAEAATLRGLNACTIAAAPLGRGVELSALDHAAMVRMLTWLGTSITQADSLASALIDWQDADEDPVAGGAERAWYVEHGRVPPRDAAFADPQEIRLVRGFDSLAPSVVTGFIASVAVDGAPMSLAHATPAALASLRGFGPEAIQRTVALQSSAAGPVGSMNAPQIDLIAIGGGLSQLSREEFARHATELAGRVTSAPVAWRIQIAASDPIASSDTPIEVTMELTVVRARGSITITRTLVNR